MFGVEVKKIDIVKPDIGFKVDLKGLLAFHLHYYDATVLLGVVIVDNLWTIKVILMIFYLSLGIKVNSLRTITLVLILGFFGV